MERNKHLFTFIGLLIATVALALLTYGAWFGNMPELEGFVAYVVTILWVFITSITIGFAWAFPRKKTVEKENEEKPVEDWEPVDEEIEKTEEKKELVFKEVIEKTNSDKAIEQREDISKHIPQPSEADLDSDHLETVILLDGFVSKLAKELAKELKDSIYFDEPQESQVLEKEEVDVMSDIQARVETIAKEKEIDKKVEDSVLDKKVDEKLAKSIPTEKKKDAHDEQEKKIKTEEKESKEMPITKDGYTLYMSEGRGGAPFHYFSKKQSEKGEPCTKMPEGREIGKTQNGVPYLKKVK